MDNFVTSVSEFYYTNNQITIR